MHYEGTPYHCPHWSFAPVLYITQGCTHNRCRFCNMYRDVRFHMQPMEYIEEDLRELKRRRPELEAIQLQAANPIAPSLAKLEPVFELIQRHYPGVKVLAPTRVSDFRNKTVDDLKRLRELGLVRLTLGIESCDEWTLQRIDKGYHADEILPLLGKLDAAGILYELTFLNGVAGRSHSKEHAIHTAEVFNRAHPAGIGVAGLVLFPDIELARDAAAGTFDPLSEKEMMEELYLFLETLEVDATLLTHHTVSMNLNGPFNARTKPERLRALRDAIDNGDLERLSSIRARKQTL